MHIRLSERPCPENYSKKSISGYGNALRRFAEYLAATGIRQVSDVTCDHLLAYRLYLQEKGYSQATMDVYLRSVRGLFTWLEAFGRIFLNPAQKLKTPRYQRRLMPVPSEQEIKQLLMQADQTTATGYRNRAMLELLYSSGIRAKEILGLDLTDIDMQNRTALVLGKGDKQRVVPVGRTAMRYLETYVKAVRPYLVRSTREPALFLTRAGTRLSYATFNRAVAAVARRSGLDMPISPHTFRRSCTTELIRGGANSYLFAGEQYDPNARFYYLRARWMNPEVGRFISTDPWEGTVFSPFSLNKYLYVDANPVNYIDPSGLQWTIGSLTSDAHYQVAKLFS